MASRGNAISGYLAPFSKGALIYGANIQSGVITSAHIANGTIVAADVASGSITSAKIGTGAVVAAKIGALAITSAKVSTSAIVKSRLNSKTITGAIISAGVIRAIAHGMGKVPSLALVVPWYATADCAAATTGIVIGESAVSAATSVNIYVVGNKAAIKFKAFLLI